VCICDDK
jgi:hypothetical protein